MKAVFHSQNGVKDVQTLQIEISDDIYAVLRDLAQDNAIDLPTLLRIQAEQLAQSYRKSGITKGLSTHLAESIEQHRHLLQRLAE